MRICQALASFIFVLFFCIEASAICGPGYTDWHNCLNYPWARDASRPAMAPLPQTTSVVPTNQQNELLPGKLPGVFDVTGSGQATYQIQFEVPIGANGFQPNIGAKYTSGGPNGYLGVGWSLGGFSAVHRCGSSRGIDGSFRSVKGDQSDNFCLDGMRLHEWNGRLRKQRDDFSEIRQVSPQLFLVEYKGGGFAEYGSSSDELCVDPISDEPHCDGLESMKSGTVRAWHVKRRVDQHGNEIRFYYDRTLDDAATVEHVPSGIEWSDRRAQFEYEPRGDVRTGYRFGTRWERTKRLSDVSMYNRGDLVRDYRFSYSEFGIGEQTILESVEVVVQRVVCCPPRSSGIKTPVRRWIGISILIRRLFIRQRTPRTTR